jgi:hypothetical protein
LRRKRCKQETQPRQHASAKSINHDGILPNSFFVVTPHFAVVRRSRSHAAASSAAAHDFQIIAPLQSNSNCAVNSVYGPGLR